jgi:hypothetical protein
MSIGLTSSQEVSLKPIGLLENNINLIYLLACGLWAAVVCKLGWPGSAVAVSYVLPLLLVIRDLKSSQPSLQVKFSIFCSGLAVIGLAISPGWFNMVVAWGLLLGTTLLMQSDDKLDALSAAWSAAIRTITSPFEVIKALPLLAKLRGPAFSSMPKVKLASVALPILAGLVFLALLTIANPVIEAILKEIDLVWLWKFFLSLISPWAIFVFFCATVLLWPMLQSTRLLQRITLGEEGETPAWYQTFFKPSAVITTLVLLNIMFIFQNILDVKYVWLTGELPVGMTQTEYVRRGAYSLIVTALLAAAFVVFALRKDTSTANNKTVRILVYLWIAQNIALVASSAQRTMTYIQDTGWTELRVSALLWMGLVCFGLATVIWRVGKNYSTVWLINANIGAAVLLLAGCSVADIKGFVAERNVDKAIAEPDFALDFKYLERLKPAAKSALQRYEHHLDELERASIDAERRLQVSGKRASMRWSLSNNEIAFKVQQSDWRTWSLRYAFTNPVAQ